MEKIVIAGGPQINVDLLLPYLKKAEHILAADSGANWLYKCGVLPDRLIGDLDSIGEETLQWIKQNQIHTDIYPIEKDMTDSEMCLRELGNECRILFVTSLTGRPDHVLSNLLLCGKLTEEGFDICMTDGTSWIYPLCGPAHFVFTDWQKKNLPVISLLPLFSPVTGVTTEGLHYPLIDATLNPGSSFSVSNCFSSSASEKKSTVHIESGVLLLMLVND